MGHVELRHRHFIDNTITMIDHAKLPSLMWDFGVLTTCYLYNRNPTPILQGRSSLEVLFQEHLNTQSSSCSATSVFCDCIPIGLINWMSSHYLVFSLGILFSKTRTYALIQPVARFSRWGMSCLTNWTFLSITFCLRIRTAMKSPIWGKSQSGILGIRSNQVIHQTWFFHPIN